MAHEKVVKGIRIVRLERLTNSANGNPRYAVTFNNGTEATTQADASLNYGITNPEAKEALDVTFSRAGTIASACRSSDGKPI